MDVKREQPLPSPAHDTYDLAVTLRRRLADAVRSESSSVASQLQSAARERLGSDGSGAGRDRSAFRSRRSRRSRT
jgi:hypothetical protein